MKKHMLGIFFKVKYIMYMITWINLGYYLLISMKSILSVKYKNIQVPQSISSEYDDELHKTAAQG